MTMARRWRRGVVMVAALGLVATGCGSGVDGSASTPTVASLPDGGGERGSDGSDDAPDPGEVDEATAEDAQLRFEQCLVDQGIDTDGVFGGGGDGDTAVQEIEEGEFEAFEAALETCEPILEDVFGDFTLSPEQEAELRDLEAQFAQCMNDRGFETATGETFELPEDIDPDELDAAFEICGEVFERLGEAGGAE